MPEGSPPSSRAANMDDLLAWAEVHQSDDDNDGVAGDDDADQDDGGAVPPPPGGDRPADTTTEAASDVAGNGDPWLDDEPMNWHVSSKTRRHVLYGLGGVGAVAASGGGWYLEQSLSAREEVAPAAADQTYTPEHQGFSDRADSLVAPSRPPNPRPELEGQLVWEAPSEAAQNTPVPGPTILDTEDHILHLLRRATFGPTPGLVDDVRARGVDSWLEEQLDPESTPDGVADLIAENFPLDGAEFEVVQDRVEPSQWHAMLETGRATMGRQIWSRHQLYEVMVDLWANHLNVPCPGAAGGWDVAPDYHHRVIRQHAFGRFEDMLLAAVRHPALLRYLNNSRSRKESVNENLGRELLELHTVGLSAGYTEEDVRNSSYILTGRIAPRNNNPEGESQFHYNADWHWTGEVRVLEFRHDNATAEGGLEVGDEYLRYLANHPATARTIARRVAIRFVKDDPPEELLERLAQAYTDHGTAIVPVLETLFRSSEFWAAVGEKTRRPLETVVASARALGPEPGDDLVGALTEFYGWATQSGHRPLSWPAPDGYPDVQPPWRSVSGMLEVWNSQRRMVRGWPEGVVFSDADELLPSGAATSTAGDFVDSMCRRLCHQEFAPEYRQALLDYLDADEMTPSSELGLDDPEVAGAVASLILHSPYFVLR